MIKSYSYVNSDFEVKHFAIFINSQKMPIIIEIIDATKNGYLITVNDDMYEITKRVLPLITIKCQDAQIKNKIIH